MPCPFPPPPQLTEGEFIDVVAAAVGVRAYHRASGRPMPKLPELADNQWLGDLDMGKECSIANRQVSK